MLDYIDDTLDVGMEQISWDKEDNGETDPEEVYVGDCLILKFRDENTFTWSHAATVGVFNTFAGGVSPAITNTGNIAVALNAETSKYEAYSVWCTPTTAEVDDIFTVTTTVTEGANTYTLIATATIMEFDALTWLMSVALVLVVIGVILFFMFN